MTKLHDVRFWSAKFWYKEPDKVKRSFERQAQYMNGPNGWVVDPKLRIIIEDVEGTLAGIQEDQDRRNANRDDSMSPRPNTSNYLSSMSSSSSSSSMSSGKISVTSLLGRSHSIRSELLEDAEEFDEDDCHVNGTFVT